MKIAIIGGTGKLGLRLARRLSSQCEVMIGSRDPKRARDAAAMAGGASGGDHADACDWADTIIFAVPYSGLDVASKLGREVEGKLVLSAINPLKLEGGLFRTPAQGGSAAEELARLFPRSRVATAFNNIPATLLDHDEFPPVDVLVASDTAETYREAARVVSSVKNLRPLYAGPLSQAHWVEGLTALILNLGKLNSTRNVTVHFGSEGGLKE